MPRADDESVADRLAALELREAARQIAYDYCWAIDSSDDATLARLFADDAVLSVNGELIEGATAIRALFASKRPDIPRGRHLVSNPRLALDSENRVRMECYFAFLVLDSDGDDGIARVHRHGRYELLLRRDGDALVIQQQQVQSARRP
jgi:ketosteroid isomerase-like protein